MERIKTIGGVLAIVALVLAIVALVLCVVFAAIGKLALIPAVLVGMVALAGLLS